MSGVSVFNLLGKLAIDGVDETKKLIDYTDQIYLGFGADPKLEGTEYKEEINT